MKVIELISQVRADLRTSIPPTVLRQARVRERIAEILGESVDRIQAESADQRGTSASDPERSRARELADAITIQDGMFFPSEDSGVVVEDLTITSRVIYVRARGESELCREIIRRVGAVLTAFGVPELDDILEEYAYGTSVTAEMDMTIESLIAPNALAFLRGPVSDAVVDGDTTLSTVVHPYALSFKVHAFPSLVTGIAQLDEARRIDFKIAHPRAQDHDNRIFELYGELSSETQLRLIAQMETTMRQPEGPS